MYPGLISVIRAARPNGRQIRIVAEVLPIEVSARTFRACL